MRQILKWKLAITGQQEIQLPVGSAILAVQIQRDDICIWVNCDPSAVNERRIINIFGTGQSLPDRPGKYLGTIQMMKGQIVWHVFDGT